VRRLYLALVVMLVLSNAVGIAWGRAHGTREYQRGQADGFALGYPAGRDDEGRAAAVRQPHVVRGADGRADTLYVGVCKEVRPRTEALP
jgi:hypothetical protein